MKKLVQVASIVSVLALLNSSLSAAVKLPALIGDHMVLQQGKPVPIWGWADKGEEVTVTVDNQKQTTKAGDNGCWKVTLKKMKPGKPLEMTIKGSSGNSITLKNILVGEVWVCSGQSNMEMGIGMCNDAQQEIAAANYPEIRLFLVTKAKAEQPATDVQATWAPCSPQSVAAGGWGGFSAAAYYFGREINKELKVPIGLIDTAWGGTPAEFWTSRKALEANPVLKPLAQGEASCLYNGQLAPLIPYAIQGAIWYQGESNLQRAFEYRTLFPAMIANWRADWGQGDFPFGFVQLAPYRYNDQDPANFAELCEAQFMTLKKVPNTGMAVTLDIGDVKDIHPRNKQDVGKRLALWALAQVYHKKLVYSGPIYKSMTARGKQIKLQFDHCGGGLSTSDGKPPADFTIAGADQKFLPAKAEISGNTIIVSNDEIAAPVAVRYAWYDTAQPNLINKEKLPASSFRTDIWKGVTEK